MINLEKEILKEQQRTNELLEKMLNQNKNPNELLTAVQVHKEFHIGINMVQKMFRDPELPVQRYTIPFKVTRRAIEDYINVRHDYLCEN